MRVIKSQIFIKLFKSLLLAAFLMVSTASVAQVPVYIFGVVKNTDTRKKMEGVSIELVKDGVVAETYITTASGKFEFDLEFDHKYDVRFVMSGYVTKFITFNTNNVPESERSQGFSYSFEMSLFEEIEGVDVAILKKPIGIILYDPEIHDFNYDLAYTQSIHEAIDKLRRDLEAKRQSDLVAKQEAERQAEQERAEQEHLAEEKRQQEQERALLEQKFEALLAEASQLFSAQDYKQSEKKYQDALLLFPDNAKARDGLTQAQLKLKEIEEKERIEKEFNDLVASADGQFIAQDFQGALTTFELAQKLVPTNSYVNEKIKTCKTNIAELAKKAEEERIQAEKAAKYSVLIDEGNKLFNAESYKQAIAKYQQSSQILPNETYPKEQIAAANKKIAEQEQAAELARLEAEKEANYKTALTKADGLFSESKFELAIKAYNEALAIKSEELYPKEKIELANKALLEQAKREEEERKAREIEGNYQKAMASGKQAFDVADYTAATNAYKQALSLKPNDAAATSKISEIESILAEIAAEEAREAEEAKKALELEENYKAKIILADNAFKVGDFEGSLALYDEALNLKPLEPYPANQINKAKEQIKLAEEKAAEEARKKELETQFVSLMSEGNTALEVKNVDVAEEKFNAALALLPGDARAVRGLDKVASARAKLAAEAKEKAIRAEYDAKIEQGDNAFNTGNYGGSVSFYEDAQTLIPSELYPTEQIEKAREQIRIAEEKAAEETRIKALAEQINGLLSDGNAALSAGNFDVAEAKFSEVISLKANEPRAIEGLEKTKLARAEAARIEAERKAAEEAARKAKELEEQYQSKIAAADNAYNSGDFAGSIALYEQALTLKSAESYPVSQIEKAEEQIRIAEERAAEEARLQALQEKVAQLVADGNAALSKQSYDLAESKYTEALAINSQDESALTGLDKVKKAREAAARKASAEEAARKAKELEENYQAKITTADNAFKVGDFDGSIALYGEALSLKPGEAYPTEQIEKAKEELRLAQERAAEEAKKAEAEASFVALMEEGDNALSTLELSVAESKYNEALRIIPNDPRGLRGLDKLVAAKAKKAAEDEAKALEQAYNDKVLAGDNAFNAGEYQTSIARYEEASQLKPSETYPTEQIAKANEQLRLAEEGAVEAARQAQLEAQIKDLLVTADNQLSATDLDGAEGTYNQVLALQATNEQALRGIEQVQTMRQQASEAEAARLAAEEEARLKAEQEAAEEARRLAEEETARLAREEAERLRQEEEARKAAELAAEQEVARLAAEEAARLKAEQEAAEEAKRLAEEEAAQKAAEEAERLRKEEEARQAAELKAQEEAAKQAAEAEAARKAQEQEENYQAKIATADNAFKVGDYNGSIALYGEALSIKTGEIYPTEQIEKAKEQLRLAQEQAEAESKKAELEATFVALLEEGDKALSTEDLSVADSKYNEALRVLPNDPRGLRGLDKLAAAKAKKAASDEAEAMEQAYNDKVLAGDNAFNAGEYQTSITRYEEALQLKPSETYPTEQIAKANEQLRLAEEGAVEVARQAQLEAQIKDLLVTADNQLSATDLDGAEGTYNQVLALQATNEQALRGIEQVQTMRQQASEAKAARLAAEEEARLKAEQEAAEEARRLAEEETARLAREEAERLRQEEEARKAAELVAEQEVARLAAEETARLKAEQLEQEEARKATELENRYQEAIKLADAYFVQNQWEEAMRDYENALSLKPNDVYATSQIEKSKNLIEAKKQADLDAAQLAAEEAARIKAEQEAAEEAKRLAEEEAARLAREEAERLRKEDEARKAAELEAEQEAARLAAEEEARKKAEAKAAEEVRRLAEEEAARLAREEAERKRLEVEAKKQAEIDAQRLKEENFKENLAQADKAFDEGDFLTAITFYQKALELKIGADYPQKRIDEAKKRLEELESVAQAKMKEREALENFNSLINSGNGFFEEESYEQALSAYQEALTIIPSSELAVEKISTTKKAIQEKEQQAQNDVLALENDKNFNSAMDAGEASLAIKDYLEAINSFKRALQLKPGNEQAANKLTKAQQLLKDYNDKLAQDKEQKAQQEREAELARQKAAEEESKKQEEAEALAQQQKIDDATQKIISNDLTSDAEIQALLDALRAQEEQEKYEVIRRQKEMLENWNNNKAKLDEAELEKIKEELNELREIESEILSRDPVSYEAVAQLKIDLDKKNKTWAELSETERARIKAELDEQRNVSVNDPGQQNQNTLQLIKTKEDLATTYKQFNDRSSNERDQYKEIVDKQKEFIDNLYKTYNAKKSYADDVELYKAMLAEADQQRTSDFDVYRAEIQRRIDSLRNIKVDNEQLAGITKENHAKAELAKEQQIAFLTLKEREQESERLAIREDIDESSQRRTEELLIRDTQRQGKAEELKFTKEEISKKQTEQSNQQLEAVRNNQSNIKAQESYTTGVVTANKDANINNYYNSVVNEKQNKEEWQRNEQQRLDGIVAGALAVEIETKEALAERDKNWQETSAEQLKENKQEVDNIYMPEQIQPDGSNVEEERKMVKEFNDSQYQKQEGEIVLAVDSIDVRRNLFYEIDEEKRSSYKPYQDSLQLAKTNIESTEISRQQKAQEQLKNRKQEVDNIYVPEQTQPDGSEVDELREKVKEFNSTQTTKQSNLITAATDSIDDRRYSLVNLDARKKMLNKPYTDSILQAKELSLEKEKQLQQKSQEQLKQNKQKVDNVYVPEQIAPDAEKVEAERKAQAEFKTKQNEKSQEIIANNEAKIKSLKEKPKVEAPVKNITESKAVEGKKIVVTRVVTEGEHEDTYKMVVATWGTFYFKNEKSITEDTWKRETQP